jgi:hypothetical protein
MEVRITLAVGFREGPIDLVSSLSATTPPALLTPVDNVDKVDRLFLLVWSSVWTTFLSVDFVDFVDVPIWLGRK